MRHFILPLTVGSLSIVVGIELILSTAQTTLASSIVDRDAFISPSTAESADGSATQQATFEAYESDEDSDIDITVRDFDVLQDRLRAGRTDVVFTLQNTGLSVANSVEVDILYSDDSRLGNEDDLVVGTFEVKNLPPKELLTQKVSVRLPNDVLSERALTENMPNKGLGYVSTGTDFLGVHIDPRNKLPETNEANNLNAAKGVGLDDVTYFPWDVDNNGRVTLRDAVYTLSRLGMPTNSRNQITDFDRDNLISSSDAIAIFNRLGYRINPTISDPVNLPGLPPTPRLFVTSAKLAEIRSAVTVAGSHHQVAFQAIKSRVDQRDWQVYDEDPTDDNWNYARAWLAREAAFLYLITGNQTYAQTAFDALYDIHNDPDPDKRLPEYGYGLGRAATGMGFALAYDWASTGWTAEQKNYVKDKILLALDEWPKYDYPNFVAPYSSNWVAVSRGAELVMMLSIGEEDSRAERFEQLKFWLEENLKTAYGELGLTQEGEGYLSYAGGFLLPAVYALRSIGDTDLERAFSEVRFEKLALYASAFNAEQTALQFGVGEGKFYPEGWSSFLLESASNDLRLAYQYFYDRFRGLKNPAPDDQKFEHLRAGSVWSVLYYPTDTTGINPTKKLPAAIQDAENGTFLFRNRWQDENDILVSLRGDFTHHWRSWDQPEAFSLSLQAYDTLFFGGPAKETEPAGFSRLLVDGEVGAQELTGEPDFFTASETGGYAIVDGGELYSSLGIDSAKRHLLVDFAGESGTAILSTLDSLEALESRLYTWQANLGKAIDNTEITATAGQESGVKTFVLRGNNDGFLKGWVLNPSDATLLAGDPLQVETTGRDRNIWIVMLVGQGTPPTAEIEGTGLESKLRVGDALVYFDATANRIISKKP
ncbi:MAG: hypothetical protein AAFP20_10540 [Cyanobacteria bacterium J06614_10]